MTMKTKFQKAIVKINHFIADAGPIGHEKGYRVLFPRADAVDEKENPTLYWILEAADLSKEIDFFVNSESLNSMEKDQLKNMQKDFKVATEKMFKFAKTANWKHVEDDWKIIKRNRKKGKDLPEYVCKFVEDAISDLKNKSVVEMAKNTKTR